MYFENGRKGKVSAENRRVSRFNDGTALTQLSGSQWTGSGNTWCVYNDDPANDSLYGYYYNYSGHRDASVGAGADRISRKGHMVKFACVPPAWIREINLEPGHSFSE